jgi:hypothetical protein
VHLAGGPQCDHGDEHHGEHGRLVGPPAGRCVGSGFVAHLSRPRAGAGAPRLGPDLGLAPERLDLDADRARADQGRAGDTGQVLHKGITSMTPDGGGNATVEGVTVVDRQGRVRGETEAVTRRVRR